MEGFKISGGTPRIYLAETEDCAVKTAARRFCEDIFKLCGAKAEFTSDKEHAEIIIETVEEDTKKEHLELLDAKGNLIWEAYLLKVSMGKLYIYGSKRRGTIFGIYELSGMWGVSPWHWFADVPVRPKKVLQLCEGFYKFDYPSVKYRGIFINDEEELEAWAVNYMKEKTIGPKTYEKIFELLLRLKANYIWPAMHVNAFNMEKENGKLANDMGIVIGTSHCDMLLRSNQNEWVPWVQSKGYEGVEYDYSIEGKNREIIQEYWTESILQNKDYDVCYTVGMRGIHDSGFITREISSNQKLTEEQKQQEKIKLLEEVIHDQQELIQNNTSKKDSPQIFIPYKEVMLLYDKGLKVPEDITLIWVNDNFGYMRRYPNAEEQKRKGGHGLYYHASYWAHPGMSYLFFNSTPLAHTKNELKKAYENGIQKIWVLNAGALKPLEIDIEFFITHGWEVNRNEVKTGNTADFIKKWINNNFTGGIGADAADIYETFSQIINVRKVEHMKSNVFSQTTFGNEAARRMLKLENLFERTVKLHDMVEETEKEAFFQLFAMKIYAAYFINASFYYADKSILMYKHGYMQAAEENTKLSRQMDEYKRMLFYYYNKVMCDAKWDKILTPESFLPPCTALYPAAKPALVIEKNDSPVILQKELEPLWKIDSGYSENDGYISILAAHYERNTGWKELEKLGRYEDSLLEADGGILEYEFHTMTQGAFLLELYRFPTLCSTGRLRIGIGVDDFEINVLESNAVDEWRGSWKQNVMNNGEKMYLKLSRLDAGRHRLTIYSIDKYVAFSKIVIYTKGFVESYLGPCESYHAKYNPEPCREEADYRVDKKALDKLCARLFQCDSAPLPEVIFADKEFWKKNRLYLKNVTRSQKTLGSPKYICDENGCKNVYEKFGKGVFMEEGGIVAFGAEYVLENSENAFLAGDENGILWEHTQSETNGRTGIAMYISENDLFWDKKDGAPSLNYKISCTKGKYNVWLLLKYDDEPNACCGIGIDGEELPQSKMFNNGFLFNYGTQQNWVWMIVAEAEFEEGTHLFSIYARASQFRVDRIYLSKTNEYPPIDAEWKECERKEYELWK